jgi:hypothetical protein
MEAADPRLGIDAFVTRPLLADAKVRELPTRF